MSHASNPVRSALLAAIGLATAGASLATHAQAPATPAAPFAVGIRVDAAKTTGPLKPIWRFFGADEPNYAYMKDGQKLIADIGKLAPQAGLLPRPQPARDRRRHAGAEVGIDQCLHRGRQRPADLRLDHRRPHLRHVSRTRREALRADRVHAAGAVGEARAVQALVDADGEVRRDLHRLGVSAEGLQEVGRPRLRMGEALRREVRQGRSRDLVLGDLERGEHRLLARHARGVPQAARLRHRRRAPRAADRARRRSRHGRPGRPVLARLLRAPAARDELRDRQGRHADRLRVVPRQGPSDLRRRPRPPRHRRTSWRTSTRRSASSRRSPS